VIQDDGTQAEAASEASRADRRDGSRRVTLRPLGCGDQSEFLELAAASIDLHHPWMSLPATPQEFQAYLARYEQPADSHPTLPER
jgi:[ribosomal protein S5]-alanine N-acetyltransferase